MIFSAEEVRVKNCTSDRNVHTYGISVTSMNFFKVWCLDLNWFRLECVLEAAVQSFDRAV
jgi:hypothetical protein